MCPSSLTGGRERERERERKRERGKMRERRGEKSGMGRERWREWRNKGKREILVKDEGREKE